MTQHDEARIEAGAKALAKWKGDTWAKLSETYRARYRRQIEAVADAFLAYDHTHRAARIKEGQARARAAGVAIGGRPRVSGDREAHIRRLLQAGTPIRAVREQTGAGNGVIARIKESIKHAPVAHSPTGQRAADQPQVRQQGGR